MNRAFYHIALILLILSLVHDHTDERKWMIISFQRELLPPGMNILHIKLSNFDNSEIRYRYIISEKLNEGISFFISHQINIDILNLHIRDIFRRLGIYWRRKEGGHLWSSDGLGRKFWIDIADLNIQKSDVWEHIVFFNEIEYDWAHTIIDLYVFTFNFINAVDVFWVPFRDSLYRIRIDKSFAVLNLYARVIIIQSDFPGAYLVIVKVSVTADLQIPLEITRIKD